MDETSTRDERQLQVVMEVIAVTIGALVGASVASTPVLVGVDFTTRFGFAALFVANFVGMALAGLVYLAWTSCGLAYVGRRGTICCTKSETRWPRSD